MKRRIFLLASIYLLIGVSAFAQRQKTTTRFLAEFDWNFIGDYTYHYIREENGNVLKDGPFTMISTVNDKGLPYAGGWYTADVTGKYNLSGNHSKGNLHGPLVMDASLVLAVSNGKKDDTKYSFRGNFKDGIPDGNFKVDYPTYSIKVNVNYKDSVLVGGYYVKGTSEDSLPFTTSGNLTSDGKMTGLWKFETISGTREITYQNGVVINRYDYDAALSEIAKEYLSGAISEEELNQQNIFVKKDSLSLGRDAWNNILGYGIDTDQIGGYSFSQSEFVKYTYLLRLPTFSDIGLEKFKDIITTPEKVNEDNLRKCSYYSDELNREFYNGWVGFDDTYGLYYSCIHRVNELSKYCKGYPDFERFGYLRIYFSDEQFAEVRQALHDARVERIDQVSLSQVQNRNHLEKYFFPCVYDDNIITYFNQGVDLAYISRDVFEDYFIKKGYYNVIQKLTPESRQEALAEKLKKWDEEQSELVNNLVEDFFETNILNVPYNELQIPSPPAKAFCPIISFKVDSLEYDKSYTSFRVHSIVNVARDREAVESDASETKRGGYKTYKLTVYCDKTDSGELQVNCSRTFAPYSFIVVKNDYDVIQELDSKINTNDLIIREKFAAQHDVYMSYRNSLDMSVNHDDLKESIDYRKEVLSVQEGVLVFITKIDQIGRHDNEIVSECTDMKDIAQAYSVYTKTRDLSWSADWSVEKINDYIALQLTCLEFIGLRDEVISNDEKIKSLKQNAPYLYKLYVKYSSACDISWKPDCDFANINSLIETQTRYLSAVNKEGISEIDKNVKKQKMTDLIAILDMAN